MTWIDLGNPIPHETPLQHKPYEWPVTDIEYLVEPKELALPSLEKVISTRRTRRTFAPLDQAHLAAFLWLSCRTIARGTNRLGFSITQRPYPSSGAIHPIHLLISDNKGGFRRYDPDRHALTTLESKNGSFIGIWQSISQVLEPERSTALVLAAEPAKIYTKYKFGNSLIWRDAGVLIGHMSLVSTGLNLNFCPLGITGEPWVSGLDKNGNLVGVGVALLGSRPINS